MTGIIIAYFAIAALLLAVLRFHPQGMEEDLLADAVVAAAWGPVALFLAGGLTFTRRPS